MLPRAIMRSKIGHIRAIICGFYTAEKASYQGYGHNSDDD